MSAASATKTMAVPMRLDVLACSTRTVMQAASSLHLREQPFRPYRQHDQKRDVACEQIPAGIELRADRLGNTENDAAGQCPPHAAESADDDGLEAEDQPRRADRRIEIGAYGKQH